MAVEPKRRRSDPALSFGCSSISRKRPVPRDVYDEILHPSGSTTVEVVHSSWLTTVRWISSSTCSQIQRPTGAQGDDEKDAAHADDAAAVSLAQEIQTLTRQLLQVKRRLGPAAERLAQARNDANHDETTTTAHWEFERARRACNPMEALGQAGGGRDRHRQRGLNHRLFMNRSAIKLANLDAAILDFGLTTKATSPEEETFVFVDLCGAPGGFSEYMLWRCCQWSPISGIYNNNQTTCCLGYGMSLMGNNEQGSGLSWKLHDQTYHSKDNANHLHHHNGRSVYVQYRVCLGSDGTGDIYNWNNVEHLQQTIRRDAAANRVPPLQQQQPAGQAHVVLADGGFDSQRDAENQEEVAQKLVVCEAAAALSLLRRGGTLVAWHSVDCHFLVHCHSPHPRGPVIE